MAHRWIATRPGGLDVFVLEEHDVPAPQADEVTISVRAAGMNPADAKHVATGAGDFPRAIGYEVAGVVTAVGPGAEIGSGPVAVGDEVLAFRISGGWATEVTVPAQDVFAKPPSLSFGEAANLLLAGTTAAEMLHVVGVARGDTILVHGASGAVGVSVLQQAAWIGARVIGTAEPVRTTTSYAASAASRSPTGTDSRSACAPPRRRASPRRSTAWAPRRQSRCRCPWWPTAVASSRSRPRTGRGTRASWPSRVRGPPAASSAHPCGPSWCSRAGAGELVVPVARSFPLADALAATELLMGQHPGGKLVLVP